MSVSVDADPVAVLNSVNLVISLGLLALGMVLIIYGFKIPEKKEDRLTNNRNGNVILVSSIAKLNLILSSKKPGAIM